MPKRDIVVIGSSAGGVYALKDLVSQLPADFNASIFVVQHVAANTPSLLPGILSRSGPLPAVHPHDGDAFEPGHIYLAPPNHHLILDHGRVLVRKGPKENRFRPSIDALFRSAAYTYGSRVIGVILTGLLNDGTSGMWTVKRLNGVSIVQSPDDALYADMPLNVMEYVDVDHTIPLAELGPLLCRLIDEPAPEQHQLSPEETERIEIEVRTAAQHNAFEMGILNLGQLTQLTCPECHGAISAIQEGTLVRYRCHTGHAFTASSLLSEVSKSVEDSFWKVLRGLEESTILLGQMGDKFKKEGKLEAADQFIEQARKTRQQSQVILDLVFQHERVSEDARLEG
ncbi:MAG: chemotaxis protein CheB [Cytophagaceae bacterium]|nr:chemotaxis protein CheB [Cytophagaceae bacterium]